jgi:HPt (histidine-containing phosphotransfer) domain-containing protein
MTGHEHDSPTLASDPAVRSLVDVEGLYRRLGNDGAAVEEILNAFARETPGLIAQLSDAVSAGELDRARRLAHSLKGSLLWIGAAEAASAAHTLESDASDSPSVPPEETLARLRSNIEPLLQALRSQPSSGHP